MRGRGRGPHDSDSARVRGRRPASIGLVKRLREITIALETGAFWGGVLGKMLGSGMAPEAVRVFAMPDVGQLMELGPLVRGIEGAGGEGAAGVLGTALSSAGRPEHSLMSYEKRIAAGEFLILLDGSSGEVERATGTLQRAGARSVESPISES